MRVQWASERMLQKAGLTLSSSLLTGHSGVQLPAKSFIWDMFIWSGSLHHLAHYKLNSIFISDYSQWVVLPARQPSVAWWYQLPPRNYKPNFSGRVTRIQVVSSTQAPCEGRALPAALHWALSCDMGMGRDNIQRLNHRAGTGKAGDVVGRSESCSLLLWEDCVVRKEHTIEMCVAPATEKKKSDDVVPVL